MRRIVATFVPRLPSNNQRDCLVEAVTGDSKFLSRPLQVTKRGCVVMKGNFPALERGMSSSEQYDVDADNFFWYLINCAQGICSGWSKSDRRGLL